MSKETVKAQIDTDITNKTTSKSISPLNVGGNMKAVVDLIPDITSLPFKMLIYNLGFLSDGTPNDTIIYNDLNGNPLINNVTSGIYEIITDLNVFISNRTFIPPFGYQGTTTNSGVIRLPIFNVNVLTGYYWVQRITSNTIRLSFTDVSGIFVNPYSILTDREIQLEIKVYN